MIKINMITNYLRLFLLTLSSNMLDRSERSEMNNLTPQIYALHQLLPEALGSRGQEVLPIESQVSEPKNL